MPRRPTNRALAESLGQRLRNARLAAGLSQERLAELASINRTYVGDIEHGRVSITVDMLLSVTRALGTTMATLVEGLDRNTASKTRR
ncbi:MAG: helix-turn-helix domain-containing protein [Actinomycetia bacterium]|nr:helix-turn-helix domain-containing protein [Actinomycetes bacterium]